MTKKQAEPAPSATAASTLTDNKIDIAKNALGAHKGKLAIGVAATLGLMVFYKWRERQLAKDDPEGYARLQRLKAGVTNGLEEANSQEEATAPREPMREIKRLRKEVSAED